MQKFDIFLQLLRRAGSWINNRPYKMTGTLNSLAKVEFRFVIVFLLNIINAICSLEVDWELVLGYNDLV